MFDIDTVGSRWRSLPVILLFGSGLLLGLAGAVFFGRMANGRSEEVVQQPAIGSTQQPSTSSIVPTSSVIPTVADAAAVHPTMVAVESLPTPVPRATPTFVPTPLPQSTHVQVIYSGADGLNLRDGPNQRKIAALLKGSYVTIRGAARDEGGFRWWPVDIEQGWMVEGPRDSSQPRWLAPIGSDQISVGQQVRVVYPGKDGLNLRRAPDHTSDKVATFLQGSSLTVAGDPRTVNGVTWWPVRAASGWIAEGATDVAKPRWIQFISR